MDTGHITGRLTSKGTRTSQPVKPGIDTAGGGFRAGAAGSKRYGSGQIAPTRGKIADKSGYVKRRTISDAAKQRALENLANGRAKLADQRLVKDGKTLPAPVGLVKGGPDRPKPVKQNLVKGGGGGPAPTQIRPGKGSVEAKMEAMRRKGAVVSSSVQDSAKGK